MLLSGPTLISVNWTICSSGSPFIVLSITPPPDAAISARVEEKAMSDLAGMRNAIADTTLILALVR